MWPRDITHTAERVLTLAMRRGVMLRTAESCTGGLVMAALTEIAGSSTAVDRGFLTYSNAAKTALVGVPETTLATHGAVSRETAEAMAAGAAGGESGVLAVAVTGIAGPGGGSAAKPVGLVWFATALDGVVEAHEARFGDPGRGEIRLAAVRTAVGLLERRLA